MRWFQVVYFQDKAIQSCLDAMVFFANPREKDSAHITIGGPFSGPEEKPGGAEILGTTINVLGAGHFLGQNQNTVFLKCTSRYLEKYWNKKDFGYNPHITIYDGKSKPFAEKLFQVLKTNKLFFPVEAGKVDTIKSIGGQRNFGLWFGINDDEIYRMTGENVSLHDAHELPDWRRITLIDRICTHLRLRANLTHHSDTQDRVRSHI